MSRTTGSHHRKHLRLKDLRRLKGLSFASRRMVEGQMGGRHASRQRGRSTEFSEHRQYLPGDDVADIDWRVYGRSDRLFIKLHEHESEMVIKVLVDGSASMRYAGVDGQTISKYDQACFLAAAIAFLTLKERDRIAFALARNGLAGLHRPAASMTHLDAMLATMETTDPDGAARLAETIDTFVRTVRRRGLLIVMSDLLDDRDAIMRALQSYVARGSEAIVFHVLHEDELTLPRIDHGLFVDSESAERVRLNVDDVRPAYERRLRVFLDGWRAACRSQGIDYNLVSTGRAYHGALERYLLRRTARYG